MRVLERLGRRHAQVVLGYSRAPSSSRRSSASANASRPSCARPRLRRRGPAAGDGAGAPGPRRVARGRSGARTPGSPRPPPGMKGSGSAASRTWVPCRGDGMAQRRSGRAKRPGPSGLRALRQAGSGGAIPVGGDEARLPPAAGSLTRLCGWQHRHRLGDPRGHSRAKEDAMRFSAFARGLLAAPAHRGALSAPTWVPSTRESGRNGPHRT